MPPQNNRQADMQGLNALSILDWLGQSNKPKDWMDVAQETAAQQTAGSPFGTAGTFAPEESGEWEPGLTSLLPTGPVDMAVETILSGIMQDNPKLGIALGLLGPRYGPKIAKGIDVAGGAALSRSQYKKGFRRAKRDPMHGETPIAAESKFIPRSEQYIQPKGGGAQRPVNYMAFYDMVPGWSLMRGETRYHPTFNFLEYSLLDMFNRPELIRKKFMQRAVAEEGRHYLQHRAGSLPGDLSGLNPFKMKVFADVLQSPKNPPQGHLPVKYVERYKAPHEVEAALEHMAFLGEKVTKRNPSVERLRGIGYTDKQIKSMLKAYKKARQAAFPATY